MGEGANRVTSMFFTMGLRPIPPYRAVRGVASWIRLIPTGSDGALIGEAMGRPSVGSNPCALHGTRLTVTIR